MSPVDIAIRNWRLTLVCLIFTLVAGAFSYVGIPKEAEPDVRIPIVYVQLTLRGISPEDSERLLLRPVETRLKSVTNVKEMRSQAFEGGGYVLLEFNAGFDSSAALADVRAKVDDAKRDLPTTADEPAVREVNLSLFPVLVVTVSGDAPERTLTTLARELRQAIEQVPGVLSADLQGARDDLVEINVDPMLLESYGVSLDQLLAVANGSNQLVAAGTLEGREGRYAVKVPSLIEGLADVADLPIVAGPNAVVRAAEVATVKRTFKDATTITRIDGRTAIAVEVVKRTGANLIETVDAVKWVAGEFAAKMPAGVHIGFSQDKSTDIRRLLGELQNSVLIAVILVFVVILYALGFRASTMIGLAIPTSFLMGIMWLSLAGLTVNIVVLFSLILAVGMLVDDAIIVAEFAERRMEEGMSPPVAYSLAAKRMAGPVFAATATRVAAFSPLLFWPGVVGEFMKYMPITLIATLSASLIFSLIFTPTLGSLFGRPPKHEVKKVDGLYMKIVTRAVDHPKTVLAIALVLLIAVPQAYGKLGKGVEFFPDVEPDYGLVHVHARGNLSLEEKNGAVAAVEARLLGMNELKTVYTRVGEQRGGSGDVAEDVIGVIQFELVDWRERRPAREVLAEIRERTAEMPGLEIEPRKPQAGPPTGKPIQIQIKAADPANLPAAAAKVAAMLGDHPEVVDIDDARQVPGIDWRLEVKRSEAAKYGVSVGTVGSAVQLVTNGLKLTDYRPSDTTDSVDIVLRYPPERRTLATLDEIRINSVNGSVPIANVMERKAAPRVGRLDRVDGERVLTVSANLREGVPAADVQAKVTAQMAGLDLGPGVRWKLKGEDEERRKASAFLSKAFGTALFLIFAVLLAQFGKFTSVALVLSAVVFSTIGVFLGLMANDMSFSVVMSGIGIIALAGVVVNNNIVLIDTYDRLIHEGWEKRDAALETCRERARPVVLTAVTAIFGVLPIAFGINPDLIGHETTIGAPSTQWWIHLSSAMVFGLAFATILTLVVTPSALMVFTRRRRPDAGVAELESSVETALEDPARRSAPEGSA
ncbi:efflux RND transporter permease subunit [Siculibacillus lacustris]|uniref:Efflux RND transporter permease subunit n=1 Tax=Siculibacillus lacustris TaxID=1549641 RepID=A0A4Q9VNH8_9HYPH|nr:efflux RND transporter permease subunit [Siculibacillus lacustris]TBW36274.1 efflux RND transporter permease subunit [Siculibacillus lacustris]